MEMKEFGPEGGGRTSLSPPWIRQYVAICYDAIITKEILKMSIKYRKLCIVSEWILLHGPGQYSIATHCM